MSSKWDPTCPHAHHHFLALSQSATSSADLRVLSGLRQYTACLFYTGSPQENFSNFFHHMLEPQYQPIAPYPSSKESMQIFEEHKKMTQDYVQVQSDLALLTQRKKKLADDLQKLDDPLDRQSYPSDPHKCFEELEQLQSEKKSLLELHRNLRIQLGILKNTRPSRENTGDGWEMVSSD